MGEKAIKIAVTAVLAAGAIALAVNRDFYASSITSEFFAVALASTMVLHLRVSPRRTDALLILAGTILFIVLDFRILGMPPAMIGCLSFMGLSSMLILGLRATWARAGERKLLVYAFVPAFLFVASEYYAGNMLDWTTAAHPKTLDLYLYTFDASLHSQFSFLMGKLFASSWLLSTVAILFYIGLPVIIAFAYGEQLVRRVEKSWPVAAAFLLTGPAGVLCYNLCPAVGPAHFFRSWPVPPFNYEQVHRLLLEPIAAAGPRNAIPSLHLAWVLLAWWYTRKTSWWARSIAMTFVVFTTLATLGTGEHYFVDLIVAFPFALMIRSVFSFSLPWSNRERIQGMVLSAVGTLVWLNLLRYAIPFFLSTPVLPWAFCVATVAATISAIHALEHAEDGACERVPEQHRALEVEAEPAADA